MSGHTHTPLVVRISVSFGALHSLWFGLSPPADMWGDRLCWHMVLAGSPPRYMTLVSTYLHVMACQKCLKKYKMIIKEENVNISYTYIVQNVGTFKLGTR